MTYRKSDEVVVAKKLMKVSGAKGRNTFTFLEGKHISILEIEKRYGNETERYKRIVKEIPKT